MVYLVLIHTQYHMKRYVGLLLQELLEFQFAAIFFFEEFDSFHILKLPDITICNVTTSKQLFMLLFFQNSLPVLHRASNRYPRIPLQHRNDGGNSATDQVTSPPDFAWSFLNAELILRRRYSELNLFWAFLASGSVEKMDESINQFTDQSMKWEILFNALSAKQKDMTPRDLVISFSKVCLLVWMRTCQYRPSFCLWCVVI